MATEENNLVLDIKDLTVHFVLEDETVEAVNHIDLKIKKGHTVGLVGETGAGKTTTALAALNMVPDPPGVIKSGSISVCGHDILSLSVAELKKVRGKHISMIFQDPMTSLNPVFTVGDQIAESIEIHEQVSKAEALQKAAELLKMVGILEDRMHEYPHQFSGGMRQRVGIAIALACNPKLVIADEPTTALDVTIQAQVLDLMRRLKDKYDTSMLMITHDLGIVAEVCDEVAVMYAGRIIEEGTLEEVFDQTKHPYTEGLFNSLPNIANRSAELKPIPGLMTDPANLPEGCAFESRCSYATERCKQPIEERKYFSKTHSVLCSAYDDPAFQIKRGTK